MMKREQELLLLMQLLVLLVIVIVLFVNFPGTLQITANKATFFHNIPETLRRATYKAFVFESSANTTDGITSGGEAVMFKETITATVANEMEKFTGSKEITSTNEMVKLNPGCKNRDINSYNANNVGKVYHHPPIVHYAKIGRPVGELSFLEYTSVLSAYKFVKPKRIIFYINNGKFTGKYWEKINAFEGVTIEVNKIPKVEKIGGKVIHSVQHAADFVKLNMIHKYGGMALDMDIIMINGSKLKDEQRISECVLSLEPGYINIGFFSCIKNSSFIAKWLEGYHKDFQPKEWVYNSGHKPTNILTDKKSDVCYNVHVDSSFCVKPDWNTRGMWLKEDAVNWRKKTGAHYFLRSGIPYNGEELLHKKFSLAELIIYVHNA